jgi:glycosyltransferase involved in cell wall biosynthesis
MRSQKLLVFHPIIAPYRIDFFNEFNKRFKTRICLFKHNLSSQKFDYSKIEEQFNFTPIYIERSKGFFHWIIGIIHQLRQFAPDIVLCSEYGIATILVVLFKIITRKKYRIVSVVDDSYNMIAEGNQFSLKHAWATKLVAPFLDNIINVEPRVVDYYKKKYKKGIFMPIIVDENKARNKYQKLLSTSQELVSKYNLEGKKILLFVGRLVCLKNLSFAIESFIEANVDNSIFVIVGDGPERERLEKMAANKKNIIFTGRLEGSFLYAWYNVASVFTLPSIQEPFGAVTNEALIGGCYSLVSKIAGSNCLIKENINGNVIDPYNKDHYIQILKKAFEKTSPISSPLYLRPNKMNMLFQDCFEKMQTKM